MAALQNALASLAPTPWDGVPTDDLKAFLEGTFSDAQLLVDSIPIPNAESTPKTGRSRANTASSFASNASEISESDHRSSPSAEDVESLKSNWGKPVKVNAKDNPLGINVYKMAGNDRKGAWFARRSVHEGLGFKKWKRALEAEFPETMKVQGAPGEGNIRGIGGERRIEYQDVDGLGRVEVYHLSAQFPGPTTPRDFVTLLMTSESALDGKAAGTVDGEIPRHFMIVSRPCIHPDCPERPGFIRGQYQSIEFIREVPVNKSPQKSASTTNLPESKSRSRADSSALGKEAVLRNAKKYHGGGEIGKNASASESNLTSPTDGIKDGRARGSTISFDRSRGSAAKGEHLDVPATEGDDEAETNPVEWIMITRSDPGGSVPRFMIERGTPGGIIGDASKFLDWACAKDVDEFADGIPEDIDENSEESKTHGQKKQIRDYQTNGHLSGLNVDGTTNPKSQVDGSQSPQHTSETRSTGLYGYISGAAGVAGATIAAYTPQVVKNHMPGHFADAEEDEDVEQSTTPIGRRASRFSVSSDESTDSFASAKTGHPSIIYADNSLLHRDADRSSVDTETSSATRKLNTQAEKELQRLEDKKRQLDEKLHKDKERELAKKSEDSEKEAAALRKAEEKHQREVEKQEEKYRKEIEKLKQKKEKEAKKQEDKKRKELDKDEKVKLGRELELAKAELEVARKERDILRSQVGELQKENTALAARVGKGAEGPKLLDEVRKDAGPSGVVLHADATGGKENSPPAA